MFSHVRVGVLSMWVLAVLATSAIQCDCNGEVECYDNQDCDLQEWTLGQCTEEEGHWECHDNLCVALCDQPECSQAVDCDANAWPADAGCAEADGHWECNASLCEAICDQPECSQAVDCEGETWPAEADCAEADGHWECQASACTAVCDVECLVYMDCEGGVWPPIEEFDCPVEEGHWECVVGECLPVCNLQCDQDSDCQAFNWGVDCDGNWDCVQGLCEEMCDPVGCGDAACDADGGETADSCAADCVELCSVPSDCVDSGEWLEACVGRWGCDQGTCVPVCDYSTCGDGDCNPTQGEDAASCTPDCLGACQLPTDCVHAEWIKICQGRYTCFMGNCDQTCDSNGCGNGTCDGALGETADSCFQDCLGGPCAVATDCLGVRWYENNCPSGGHWECAQPAGACEAVCEAVTCGDGTCDVLAGEAATGCPSDCGDYDCDLSEDCDGLSLPDGCDTWLCVNRNCNPVCP